VRFAAIDIGSNAVRLLITNVFERAGGPLFIKDSLYRVPVRLGEEAFLSGNFTDEKIADLAMTMKAFRLLMDVHRIAGYKAYATSAMREAKNGERAIQVVKDQANIDIEVISGQKEASVILHSEFGNRNADQTRYYLYIDVGGGSTELVYFHQGQVLASQSFRIGTLRLLNNQVDAGTWAELKAWIEQNRPGRRPPITAIGSGGNINKLIKVYGRARENYLTQDQVHQAFEHLSSLTYGERVRDMGLKPDRADVILPATQIFMRVMQWANIRRVIVPKFGISDGIIAEVYEEYLQRTAETKVLPI
jgi:exopolyphosphatase/guanosine-5'-triphosphate,3'-diphosphate pyrophosphatase